MRALGIWHRTAIAVVVLATIYSGFAWLCLRDPKINFLPNHRDATWIIFPTAVDMLAHPIAYIDVKFRRRFEIETLPRTARLKISAAKRFQLRVNGVGAKTIEVRNWKDVSTIDILPLLQIGTNVVEVDVFNDNGPPALWLNLATNNVALQSDLRWEASFAGSSWRPVADSTIPRFPGPGNLSAGGEQTIRSLRTIWPIWLGFTCIAPVILFAGQRLLSAPKSNERATKVVLIMFIGLWLILIWNNNRFLPLCAGFDARSHLEYIRYVQDHHAVPLPTQGFEMFHPPLYYALSATALSACRLTVDDVSGIQLLRWMTMSIGIAHFIFVFLSLRLLFPNRPGHQFVGLLLAAFFPEQLYLSNYVTNETLVATLIAAAIYFSLRVLKAKSAPLVNCVWLGFLLGAAMLTKATALLFLPTFFVALVAKMLAERASVTIWLRTLVTPIAICFILCGWYYIWIWQRFGTPLVANWDVQTAHFGWWQEPGFHTAVDYVRLGRALLYPFLSGFGRVPDGVYSTVWGDGLWGGLAGLLSRTPWNYDLMSAGYLLAIIPTVLIVSGVIVASYRYLRDASLERLLLLIFCVTITSAFIFLTLKVAAYAQVKAFYALSALTPVCYFAAIGWNVVTRKRKQLKLLFGALLIVWAMNSFASIWIHKSVAEHVYNAARWDVERKNDMAFFEARKALAFDPSNATAERMLALISLESGQLAEASEHAEHAVQLSPLNSDAHTQLSAVRLEQVKFQDAITEARQAVDLGPENVVAYDLLITALRQSERTDEAISVLRDALAVSPFKAELHFRFGLASGQIGDYATAAHQFVYAILLGPDQFGARDKLRIALRLLTKSPDALKQVGEIADLAKIAGDSNIVTVCDEFLKTSEAVDNPK